MTRDELKFHLETMRARVQRVREITGTLGEDPAVEEIDTVIRERAGFVRAVELEADALDSLEPRWKVIARADDLLRDVLGALERTGSEIGRMDSRVIACLEKRKSENRRALGEMYHTSRAAGAYAVHARMQN